MMQDHVLLAGRKCKILERFFESCLRVRKAVNTVVKTSVMPVIHKIIMKQGTADQFTFIDMNAQFKSNKVSSCCNADAVGLYGCMSVLYEFLAVPERGIG